MSFVNNHCSLYFGRMLFKWFFFFGFPLIIVTINTMMTKIAMSKFLWITMHAAFCVRLILAKLKKNLFLFSFSWKTNNFGIRIENLIHSKNDMETEEKKANKQRDELIISTSQPHFVLNVFICTDIFHLKYVQFFSLFVLPCVCHLSVVYYGQWQNKNKCIFFI